MLWLLLVKKWQPTCRGQVIFERKQIDNQIIPNQLAQISTGCISDVFQHTCWIDVAERLLQEHHLAMSHQRPSPLSLCLKSAPTPPCSALKCLKSSNIVMSSNSCSQMARVSAFMDSSCSNHAMTHSTVSRSLLRNGEGFCFKNVLTPACEGFFLHKTTWILWHTTQEVTVTTWRSTVVMSTLRQSGECSFLIEAQTNGMHCFRCLIGFRFPVSVLAYIWTYLIHIMWACTWFFWVTDQDWQTQQMEFSGTVWEPTYLIGCWGRQWLSSLQYVSWRQELASQPVEEITNVRPWRETRHLMLSLAR